MRNEWQRLCLRCNAVDHACTFHGSQDGPIETDAWVEAWQCPACGCPEFDLMEQWLEHLDPSTCEVIGGGEPDENEPGQRVFGPPRDSATLAANAIIREIEQRAPL